MFHTEQLLYQILQGESKLFHVYDTTGPYTDPDYQINLQRGLPKTRDEWILDRKEKYHPDKNLKKILLS